MSSQPTEREKPATARRPVGTSPDLRAIRRSDVRKRATREAGLSRRTSGRRAGLVARPFDPGCVVLAVCGELGTRAAADLAQLADHACAQARTELLIDLTGLERCAPAAAEALNRIHSEALARGAHVELYGRAEPAARWAGPRELAGALEGLTQPDRPTDCHGGENS